MRQIWEDIKDFFVRDWTMTEKVLIILCCLLLGIAPIKKGISCGNNNGNTYNSLDDEYWLDDEEQKEKDFIFLLR